jgi:hypothetical protein
MDTAPRKYDRSLGAAELCCGAVNDFAPRTRTLGWDTDSFWINIKLVAWVVEFSVCHIFGDIQNDGTWSARGGDGVGASYQFGDAKAIFDSD